MHVPMNIKLTYHVSGIINYYSRQSPARVCKPVIKNITTKKKRHKNLCGIRLYFCSNTAAAHVGSAVMCRASNWRAAG